MLAFQVAFVAGICATSRVLALWQTPEARAEDRHFVRRCSAIAVGALAVASAGWVAAIGLALNTLVDPNDATLAIGTAIMVASTIAAAGLLSRLRVNSDDEAASSATLNVGLLGLGEHVIGIIRDRPLVSCAFVAIVASFWAMVHAEATFSGALPWGIVQAAAVVIGFVLLGPTLGLRRSRAA